MQITNDVLPEVSPEAAEVAEVPGEAVSEVTDEVDVQAENGPSDAVDVIPGGCCKVALDCGEGECDWWWRARRVQIKELQPGRCWADADCGQGSYCDGAAVCPCGAMCDAVDQPGVCVGISSSCCTTSDDCKDGPGPSVCVPTGGNFGVCKSLAGIEGPEECWTDAQCPFGGLCLGVQVCPCDADCDFADQPWRCTPPAGCCWSVLDCGRANSSSCAETGEGFGVCMPRALLKPGECWEDADCPYEGTCEGVAVCLCMVDCDMYEHPGLCTPPKGCCHTEEDCGEGDWQCVHSDDAFGVCKSSAGLEAGQCWTIADCAQDETCTGAVIAPCMAEIGPDLPGICTQ